MTAERRCQVLVIGSGPGGAVTAATLAECGQEVLMVEEGPHLPLDACPFFSPEEMVLKYRAGGLNPALGSPRTLIAEARCVGGGSEINSGLYHRTPPEILAAWRDHWRVRDLASEDLAPHFQAVESALSVQVGRLPPLPAAAVLRRGAERLGWRSMEVPRWYRPASDRPGGAGLPRRQSMTETFVPAALRAGARLWPDTRAERLERSGGGRWRVKMVRAGRAVEVEADAVFVCGGAVQTPLLLRRSGIRTHVGRSLAFHPTVKVVALFDQEVNGERTDVPAVQVKEFSPRIGLGCSVSTLPHLALAMADHPRSGLEVSRDWRRMAIYYAMIAGPSAGTVRPVPFSRDPLIRYRLADADLRALADGLRRLCRLLLAAGARRLFPSVRGQAPLSQEDDLTRIPAALPRDRTSLMTIHLFSSCPMGEDPARCATDSFGQVHGQRGLHVGDASLLCSAPGVNPQGTIMALARRNALAFAHAL